MKGERVAQLELLLRSHPEGMRRAEIARRLGVHRSTISRYVEDLSEKIDIYEENNLIKIRAKEEDGPEMLSVYESLAFNMSAELLASNIEVQNPHLASGLRKIAMNMRSYAPKVSANIFELADKIDEGVKNNRGQSMVFNKILEVLIDCWISGHIARITSGTEEIEIAPYFIGFKDEKEGRKPITVTGRLRHTMDIVTLDIASMTDAVMLDETYTIPDNLKPFKQKEKQTQYDAIDMIPLTLRLREKSALNSFSTIIHGKPELRKNEKGELIASFDAENSIELMLRIIQSGTSVEIISPENYKRRLISDLEDILSIYKRYM